MRFLRHWVDIPPVWLLGFLAVAWAQATYLPLGFGAGADFIRFVGGLLVGGGVVLIALAAYEMARQRTTILPHRPAGRLVTTGIFSRSRNPIYLGDTLILTGLCLGWDAIGSLPLVPIFVWIIEQRFILQEEAGLRRNFRADFARYCHNTRRWV